MQSAAETLRKAELAEVIAKIRVAVAEYGITPQDVFAGKSKKSTGDRSVVARKNASNSKSKGDLTAKFGDATGNTWVGRGPHPIWLREALLKGKSLSDFAVAGAKGSISMDAKTAVPKAAKKVAVTAEVKAPKKPVAAKYRDGMGNTWTGRGSQPRWLKQAVAAGKTLGQLKV